MANVLFPAQLLTALTETRLAYTKALTDTIRYVCSLTDDTFIKIDGVAGNFSIDCLKVIRDENHNIEDIIVWYTQWDDNDRTKGVDWKSSIDSMEVSLLNNICNILISRL